MGVDAAGAADAQGHRGEPVRDAAGFAPRAGGVVVYLLDGTGAHADALERLGPHRLRVGSIEIPDLEAVDLDLLGEIVAASFRTLTAGVYTRRARESGDSVGE